MHFSVRGFGCALFYSVGGIHVKRTSIFVLILSLILSAGCTPRPAEEPSTETIPTTGAATTVAAENATVWVTLSGKKYHHNPTCSNMYNPVSIAVNEAERLGYTPCKWCYGK